MDSGLSWRRSRSVWAAGPDAASDTIAMRKPSRGAAAMVNPPASKAARWTAQKHNPFCGTAGPPMRAPADERGVQGGRQSAHIQPKAAEGAARAVDFEYAPPKAQVGKPNRKRAVRRRIRLRDDVEPRRAQDGVAQGFGEVVVYQPRRRAPRRSRVRAKVCVVAPRQPGADAELAQLAGRGLPVHVDADGARAVYLPHAFIVLETPERVVSAGPVVSMRTEGAQQSRQLALREVERNEPVESAKAARDRPREQQRLMRRAPQSPAQIRADARVSALYVAVVRAR